MSNDSKHGGTRGARMDPATISRLDDLEDDLGVTTSQALKTATKEGLRELGYPVGNHTTHRALRGALRESARILAYGGGVLLAFTITASIEYRLMAFVLVAAGALSFGLERVLASLEPKPLSSYIPGLSGRQSAETRADGGGEQ